MTQPVVAELGCTTYFNKQSRFHEHQYARFLLFMELGSPRSRTSFTHADHYDTYYSFREGQLDELNLLLDTCYEHNLLGLTVYCADLDTLEHIAGIHGRAFRYVEGLLSEQLVAKESVSA